MPTITRRTVLLGGAAFVASSCLPALTWATPVSAPLEPGHDAFMALSQALVNHQLQPDVGARIAAYAQQTFPGFAQTAKTILAAAQARNATRVEDFFDDIPQGEAKDLAHWIIAAWYSGMSAATHDATLFTFEHALTYQVTQDMAPIPSYGFTGPNRWDELPNAPLSPIPTF